MMIKRVGLSFLGTVMAAGLLGAGAVSANESDNLEEIKSETEVSTMYIPIEEGHTWTYVKTAYTSTGYIKIYSDKDSKWFYLKEVFYDKNGKYIKTVYDKFVL
ncbi:MAG: hypothetical protein ACQEUT_13160 [Bacillota bacterium]